MKEKNWLCSKFEASQAGSQARGHEINLLPPPNQEPGDLYPLRRALEVVRVAYLGQDYVTPIQANVRHRITPHASIVLTGPQLTCRCRRMLSCA